MVLLLFLAGCLSLISAQTCSRQYSFLIHPAPSEANRRDYCIQQATLTAASFLRALSNGSCLLFNACAAKTTSEYPLYRRLLPGSPMLLMRTKPDTHPHAYDLFRKGQVSTNLYRESEPYLSPLVAMNPNPFSHLHVQLFDNISIVPGVDLTFRIKRNDSVREGAWFSKERLVAAYPWNITVMKKLDYKHFTMNGIYQRKFLVANYGGHRKDACWGSKVYMYLYIDHGVRDITCPLDNTFIKFNYYVYFPDAPEEFTYNSKRIEAFEFRILGDIEVSRDSLYIREPWPLAWIPDKISKGYSSRRKVWIILILHCLFENAKNTGHDCILFFYSMILEYLQSDEKSENWKLVEFSIFKCFKIC